MKPVSDITALVADHGLFLPLAQRLAKTYKRVLYWSPWADGFPTIKKCIIGDGFENIERCDDIWKVKGEIDLAIFPDILHSGVQLELESQGVSVWGSRDGDSLEMFRQKYHRVLGEIGLEVPPFVTVLGLTNLREHLKDEKDKYLKISKYRGDQETVHWRSWKEDEGMLDGLAVKFGPAKELIPFMVFDSIETDLEIGGDTYCVDGQWPSLMIHGDEYKDKGYLGSVTKREDMPDHIKQVLEAFSPILKDYRYRNQFSIEVRVVGDKAYPIDGTLRAGQPSTSSQIALWSNLPEIIWHGANGELVDPIPTANFSAECVLTMKGEKNAWGKTVVPEELKDWMLLGSCCEIDGATCFPPDDSHGEEIGWLVATGDTISETIDTMKDRASKLPDGVAANIESLVELLKEVKSSEEQGIEFTDQPVPPPESVIAEA